MIEELIVSSYLLFSSWIYGYFVIRRAFWVVRLIPSKERLKLSFLFALPIIIPFAILLWIVPPLYLFSALAITLYLYSYYIQTHPKYLMKELLNYIGIRELVKQQPSEQDIRVMMLKQRLMRSVELNKDLIDKISNEIKLLRETLKSMEAAQAGGMPSQAVQTKAQAQEPKVKVVVPQVSQTSTSKTEHSSQELLTDKDLAIIQEKIRKLRKKYQLEE